MSNKMPYSEEELVSRVMRNIPNVAKPGEFYWSAVAELFLMGSTYSIQLCKAHNIDPYGYKRGSEATR